MKNSELMQEIQKLEQALPSGPDYTASGFNYTKIGDCEFPDNWKCPISLGLLIEPVHASDGFTYEKAEFEQYIAARNATNQPLLSPSTGAVLPAGALCFPANQLSSGINTMLENKLAALKKLVETIKENEKKLHALVQQGLAHKNKKEYIQAIACFKEAAEQEHAGGWYHLATMYGHGFGVDKNPEEATALFNKVRSSAEKGNAFALYYLGQMAYFIHQSQTGYDVRRDWKKVAGYYRQAAENGIVEAMYILGNLHLDSLAKDYGLRYRDRGEIMKWFTLAADQGHAEAQYMLAGRYAIGDNGEHGYGPIIPKNHDLACHYYQLAADQGHPCANQALEHMRKKTDPQPSAPPRALLNPNEVSLFDNDTPVDYTSYFTRQNTKLSSSSNSSSSSVLTSTQVSSSSSSSSIPAPSVVSQPSFFPPSDRYSVKEEDSYVNLMLIEGLRHLNADQLYAAKQYFEETAKQKSPEACYYLAKMYEDEKIWVQNNNDRSLYIQHWYTLAALFGHTEAAYRMGEIHDKKQYRLGSITIDGQDISFAPQNTKESYNWYLRAGPTHAGAQYKLGLYHEKWKKPGIAYSYYQRSLAANNGHHAAADALAQLSAAVQVELDSYASQKDLANKSALWGPSEDDVARVTLAIALRGKLSGQEMRMFSKKEVELIFSSDRLNAILNKPQHSWIMDKLRGEWAEEPQAQNAPMRMGMSNGR